MAKRDELIALADELDGWHDCADGDVHAGNGHFRLVCVQDSEQQRLNLRATLRETSTALRILSALEAPAAGDGEPVAWRWQEEGWGDYWIYNPEPGWLAEQNNIVKQPLYTAPPADAGMREAFVRVLASLAAAISILERTPKAKKAVASDKMFDTMLDDYRKALEAGRTALTAPGATTKSDGGEQPPRVGLDWKLSDDAKQRLAEIDAAIVRPGDPRLNQIIGGPSPIPFTGYSEYTPVTVRGSTSDPSSTRSDVTALADVAKERHRQRDVEGWTPAHDDTHVSAELAMAGACYALASFLNTEHALNTTFTRYWPWDRKWWKPKTPRENLVRAGALIVAEIERLDRLDQFEIRRKK